MRDRMRRKQVREGALEVHMVEYVVRKATKSMLEEKELDREWRRGVRVRKRNAATELIEYISAKIYISCICVRVCVLTLI